MWFLSYAGFKARKKNESFFENYVGNEFKIRVRDDFFIFQKISSILSIFKNLLHMAL